MGEPICPINAKQCRFVCRLIGLRNPDPVNEAHWNLKEHGELERGLRRREFGPSLVLAIFAGLDRLLIAILKTMFQTEFP